MNRTRPTLRSLSLGIALAVATPLAFAQQDRPADMHDTMQHGDHMSQSNPSSRDDRPTMIYRDDLQADNDQRDRDMPRQNAMNDDAMRAPRQIRDRPGQSARDARREAVIWTSFALNDRLEATDVDVMVDGGKATLTGTVESQIERDLAGEIARSVSGIERVDNRIRIDPDVRPVAARSFGDRNSPDVDRDFSTTLADATTTATVKSKLLWNTATDGLDINVDTRFGRVTLSGTADSAASRRLAEQLARDTAGVVDVTNRLTIDADSTAMRGDNDRRATVAADLDSADNEYEADADVDVDADADLDADADIDVAMQRPDPWITSKVKSTLLFSRTVDGFDIDVDTHDGVVQLTGTVDSAQEKQTAVRLARDIRGVRTVDASGLQVGTEVAGRDED